MKRHALPHTSLPARPHLQGLFPQDHRVCKAFIRHKDIMLSPSVLRMHGIPYMQAKQMEGEFIVLNASAYHR